MKHTLLPILLFIIAAQNTVAHATPRFDEVKPAVIDFFKRSAGNPKDCALLKDANAKNPQDEQTRMLMVGFATAISISQNPLRSLPCHRTNPRGSAISAALSPVRPHSATKWVPGLFPLSPRIWWWATNSRAGPSSSPLTMTFWSMNFAHR